MMYVCKNIQANKLKPTSNWSFFKLIISDQVLIKLKWCFVFLFGGISNFCLEKVLYYVWNEKGVMEFFRHVPTHIDIEYPLPPPRGETVLIAYAITLPFKRVCAALKQRTIFTLFTCICEQQRLWRDNLATALAGTISSASVYISLPISTHLQ